MNIPMSFRLLIEKSPTIYMVLLRIKNRGRKFERFIVSDQTDLVVEGFPRCANSFAVQSIRLLCRRDGREFRFATHAHSPAHVLSGLRLGKPTLVVIREPKAAITSLQALWRQSGVSVQSVNELLKRYAQFYEMLIPYRNQMVISEFRRTTSDYPSVIRELNERFKMNLSVVESHSDLEKLVMPQSKAHLGPSDDRDAIKQETRIYFDQQADPKLLERAKRAYLDFVN